MDESSLEASIDEYKAQLSQIQVLLSASDELTKLELYDLEKDLVEMIKIAEGSLLSLKKKNLLAMLNTDGGTSDNTPEEENLNVKTPKEEDSHISLNTSVKNEDDNEVLDKIETDIQSDLVGVKCRVKYTQEWGSFQYHNAMILNCDIDDSLGDSQVKAHVLFLNPIHISMVPCKYFLNGNCDYDATCKYSHGYVVDIEELEEYEEPDFSQLRRKCKCLAKYEDDGVWYPATVDSIHEEQATVSFDTYKDTLTLNFHSILPLRSYSSDNSSEDDEVDEDDDEQLNFSELSYNTVSMSGPMGDWEKYTRGIGSKLMHKMGYIFGKGLGKNGQGKIDPVEIRLLPPGKSLDHIAELREKGKIKDPTKTKNKINKSLNTQKNTETTFDVINRLMHSAPKTGNSKDFRESSSKFSIEDSYKSLKRHLKTKHVGDAKVSKKSKDTKINLEMFKVSEKLTTLKKQLILQKEALSRNPGESSISRRIKQNIEATENEIDELKRVDQSLQNKLQMKKQSKKLTVF